MSRMIATTALAFLVTLLSPSALGDQDETERRALVFELQTRIENAEATYGENAAELIPLLQDYADSLVNKNGNWTRPHKQYRRALKISRAHFGNKSREYADLAYRAGANIFTLTDSTLGRKYVVSAYKIYTELGLAREAGHAQFMLGKMSAASDATGRAARELEYAIELLSAIDAEIDKRLLAHKLLATIYKKHKNEAKLVEQLHAIGRSNSVSDPSQMEPVLTVDPGRPTSIRLGYVGMVNVGFEVDQNGNVRNARVIDSDLRHRKFAPDEYKFLQTTYRIELIEFEALQAITQYRYAPLYEAGSAVVARGVTHEFIMDIPDLGPECRGVSVPNTNTVRAREKRCPETKNRNRDKK